MEAEKQKVRRNTMMLDRMEGNAELKSSVQLMLAARRLTHSVLLVGEEGLGAGFAARCIAADYLYPAGGAPAEALLRGECCRAVWMPSTMVWPALYRPVSASGCASRPNSVSVTLPAVR